MIQREKKLRYTQDKHISQQNKRHVAEQESLPQLEKECFSD